VDLNGDGRLDLISGSWPGELYWFQGLANGDFAAPVMLKDKWGEPINVEGGVEKQPDGMILITGKAEWETDPKTGRSAVVYKGKRYEATGDAQLATTGCATHVQAVDWNGDGVLDLLVGSIRGWIYLIPNEGTTKEWSFGEPRKLKAGGSEIQLSGDACPFCVDWDGDGDIDLLCGEDSGRAVLFENIGSAKQPVLAKPVELLPAGVMNYGNEVPEDVVRGGRSKVCAVDWNGDRLMDLLIGDISYQKAPAPKLSPEELKRNQEAKSKLEALRPKFREAMDQIYGPNRLKGEQLKQAMERFQKIRDEMDPLQAMIPEQTLRHGSVWLFLQKTGRSTTGTKPSTSQQQDSMAKIESWCSVAGSMRSSKRIGHTSPRIIRSPDRSMPQRITWLPAY
jgi:hypothetical protein